MSKWRVGGKVPLNVYEGDTPMFQCHTPEQAARIVQLLNEGEADKRRLDKLESMRPCTVQMWVGQTAIHKPGDFFVVNEYGKTLREILDSPDPPAIAAAPASKEK